ncbi:MAG: CarD family transcriptional regulator [Clostridia bacterium]|nr:CarD family transcriptional regulator [Clostridia bacterium]
MFNIGDHVVYPLHGAGTITAIESMEVMGASQEYYVINILVGNLTVRVPTGNADRLGIRYTVDMSEATKVIDFMAGMDVEEDTSSNWSKRYKDNMDRIASGDIHQVANIVKALTVRDRRKSLSTGERKMLGTARHILSSELSVVLGQNQRDIEESLINSIPVIE